MQCPVVKQTCVCVEYKWGDWSFAWCR